MAFPATLLNNLWTLFSLKVGDHPPDLQVGSISLSPPGSDAYDAVSWRGVHNIRHGV